MENLKIKVDILPNKFLKEDNTFDKEEALKLCGKIAGVCYDKEGFAHLDNEPIEKTMKRVAMTLNNGHHSVYDHIEINFNLHNIPKILAMVLNNERQYTTSEKSSRYTPIIKKEGSIITEQEELLYNKWIDLLKPRIETHYGYCYNSSKIQKLAQENARYLVTVFTPTEMVYSTSLRQINYIASWLIKYQKNIQYPSIFESKLSFYITQLLEELERLNVLDERLMRNEKHCSLSIFGNHLENKREYFGDVYTTIYKGSFAQYAQGHRHRSLSYQLELLPEKEYFIPPIIEDDQALVEEWLNDMAKVKDLNPQGELVRISESGTYENFLKKCKERLCSAAQLETMLQTKKTLEKYKLALEESNHPLAADIENYSHGARCTFPDYECPNPCGFKEGICLERKI